MTVAKNIEVSSTSSVSFDDALQAGIARVSKTIKNVQGAWIKEQKVAVENGKITSYNVTAIVTFVLADGDSA